MVDLWNESFIFIGCKYRDHAVNKQKMRNKAFHLHLLYIYESVIIIILLITCIYVASIRQTLYFDFIKMHITIYIKVLNQHFIDDMISLHPPQMILQRREVDFVYT